MCLHSTMLAATEATVHDTDILFTHSQWQTGIHSANYNYSHSAFFWQHYFAKYWHIIWPTSRSKYNMNTRHGSTSKTIPCELTLLHLVPTATCRSFSHWAAKILLILFRSYWRSLSSRGRWRARYGSTSCFCRFVPQPICRLNSAWLTKSQLGPGALSSSASQDLTHLCRTSGLAFRNTGRQCCSILRKYTVFIIGYIKHTHNTAQSNSSQAMDTLTTLLQGLFNNPKDGKRRMRHGKKRVKNTKDCIRRQRQQLNKYNAFLLSDNSSALMCAVQSRKLHTCSWLHSVQCDACCVSGERSGGQERSFRWVPGTHSETETNSDSNTEQRCADCQRGWTLPESQAEESAHKLSEPGSSNCTVWLNTAKDHKGPQRSITQNRKRPTKDCKGTLWARLQEIGTNSMVPHIPMRAKIFQNSLFTSVFILCLLGNH